MLEVLVLLLGDLLGWTQPQGIYWASAPLIIALVSLFSAVLGLSALAAIVLGTLSMRRGIAR